MAAHSEEIAPDLHRGTPQQVLKSIVHGINTGNLETLMPLYEPEAAFATQPGNLSHGLPGVRKALAGFVAMKGTLDLNVTGVLEVSDLALVTTVWSFDGTGPHRRRGGFDPIDRRHGRVVPSPANADEHRLE
jgi:hypothetical protein